MKKDDPDDVLIRRCLQGNAQEFEHLVRRYQTFVFNLIIRMVHDHDDAADLTQTVFLKVYQNLHRYKRRHKFYSWVYRIAVNESLNFIDHYRRQEELNESIRCDDQSPEQQADDRDRDETLERALAELEPNYRVLIILRHYLDYSYQDMAKVLQLPVKKVKSRLYMARRMLGDLMVKKGIKINE